MSKAVSIDELFDDIDVWGAGFVATVGDDERVRFVALRPTVVTRAHGRVLRFERAGRSTVNNAGTRDQVAIAFPPHAGSAGFSLIVDGIADVDAEAGVLNVRPTSAVLHRPAP
ncbi:MAG TPA: hypothetical protein VNQ73_12910 [Ilumatobacter sp.]|nr:hypothetical protein [Ilumatobacter sp.]